MVLWQVLVQVVEQVLVEQVAEQVWSCRQVVVEVPGSECSYWLKHRHLTGLDSVIALKNKNTSKHDLVNTRYATCSN